MFFDGENINNIVLSSAKELGIDIKSYSFKDCSTVLKSSKKLRELLKKSIGKSIKREEIDSIKSSFVKTLVEMFIDLENIEIEEDNVCYEFDENEKGIFLDSYKLYMRDISRYEVPTKKEEQDLFFRYSNGDIEAKNEIINRNQRLVLSVAKTCTRENYDILCAVQDGNFGLFRAMEDFDATLGYRFATYATYWIRRMILKERAKSNGNIKVSGNLQSEVARYQNFINKYLVTYGHMPTDKEVAEGMNVSESRVLTLKSAPITTASLNATLIDGDSEIELSDIIVDDKALLPEEEYLYSLLKSDLMEAMDRRLNDREKMVLIKRFGLDGKGELSQRQLAEILNVSDERVRQIRERALEKLRTKEKKLKVHMSA